MNKILVEIIVPTIGKSFDLFIPYNKQVGAVLQIIQKSIVEISEFDYVIDNRAKLYIKSSGKELNLNSYICDENLKNGISLILV